MSLLTNSIFFNDPNFLWVVSGACLLGVAAGVVGCFPYLRGQALIGDVLAHAALPGLTLGFIIMQERSLPVLLTGAVISSLLGYLCVNYLNRFTRTKADSALALVLSLFFALGIFQLVEIQKMPLASQAGLDSFLFGKAAALIGSDVQLLIGLALVILIFVILCQRILKYISFDPLFCRASGFPIGRYEFLLSLAVVLTVAIGMQLVGAVLMAAVLLTPAASARYWSNNLTTMLITAAILGGLSGIFAAIVSFMAPKMPTGPWMVVAATGLFVLSLLFAPERGWLVRLYRQKKFRDRIDDENILRSLYLLSGELPSVGQQVEASDILSFRELSALRLESSLSRLISTGLITRAASLVGLTPKGFERAKLLTRFHRLWEAYLLRFTEIEADHVHGDAEDIEHVLDKALIARLLAELGQEDLDPHGKLIPQEVE